MMKREAVAVLMGGRSSEREISLKSGQAVLKALRSRGYHAEPVDPADQIAALLSGSYDKAFIALHGHLGEDGALQGLLEVLGLPYTGSGVLASAATMDKAFAKKIMRADGIGTPDFSLFTRGELPDRKAAAGFDYPVIVKPASEGSTVGVTKVDSAETLTKAMQEAYAFGSQVLVERFIAGREVTVGVVDNTPLPIVEVVPKKGFYDFEAKYTKGMTDYIVPAVLGNRLTEQVSSTALDVYRLFGCRGAARVDFILGQKGPVVLEINTIPGMTETSLLPMAASCQGWSFEDLVEKLLQSASLDSADHGMAKLAQGKEPIRRVV